MDASWGRGCQDFGVIDWTPRGEPRLRGEQVRDSVARSAVRAKATSRLIASLGGRRRRTRGRRSPNQRRDRACSPRVRKLRLG